MLELPVTVVPSTGVVKSGTTKLDNSPVMAVPSYLMVVYRIRIDALLKKLDSPTAYALAKKAGIPETTAYRLVDNDGRVTRLDPKLVKKLCNAFNLDPMKLIEWVDD
jgi:hypothetical protein